MFRRFPAGTRARAIAAYDRPYDDPIAVDAGEAVTPGFARRTDILGWVWCTDSRGKSGWTPEAWIDRSVTPWRMFRAFNAIELSVRPGDMLRVHWSESGFVWATDSSGASGWVPDGVLQLD